MTKLRAVLPGTALLLASAAISLACVFGGGDGATATPTPTTQAAAPAATQPPAATATPAPTLPPTPAVPSTYVVEAGDNPTLIAEKLGVPAEALDAWVAEMLALNDTEDTALQIGQELLLPPAGGGAPVAATPDGAQPAATPAPQATEAPTSTSAQASPTTEASPTITVSAEGFGDGILTVGTDVAPGTYRTRAPSAFCYWARLSGFGGEDGDIIANSVDENGYSVVTIAASDVGFESDGCGAWSSDLSAVTSSPQAPFDDGTYIVGTDVAAGTWTSDEATDACYWEITSGFGAGLEDVIENGVEGEVTIGASDTGFYTAGCGTWELTP